MPVGPRAGLSPRSLHRYNTARQTIRQSACIRSQSATRAGVGLVWRAVRSGSLVPDRSTEEGGDGEAAGADTRRGWGDGNGRLHSRQGGGKL